MWNYKGIRISKNDRGFALPNFKLYYWAAHPSVLHVPALPSYAQNDWRYFTEIHKIRGKKTNTKLNLPWFNSNLWELMNKRDASLKKFLKSKWSTDHQIFKGLRKKSLIIIPHFLYCITSWSQACKTVTKPPESLYKSSLKIHTKNHGTATTVM